MKQQFFRAGIVSLLVLALTGCTDETNTAMSPTSPADTNPTVIETTAPSNVPDTSANTDISIPSGAVTASETFPFPIPENWAELDAFTEKKVGKDVAMYAAYEYPGEAADAAEYYKSLLALAGYQVRDDPLGALTNQASVWVEGPVNGVFYKGNIAFDSYADGTQRAVINLTEED